MRIDGATSYNGLRLLWKNPLHLSCGPCPCSRNRREHSDLQRGICHFAGAAAYRQPDRIVIVWSKIKGDRNGVSAGDYLDWKRGSTSFESMAAWTGGQMSLTTSGQPNRCKPSRVPRVFWKSLDSRCSRARFSACRR